MSDTQLDLLALPAPAPVQEPEIDLSTATVFEVTSTGRKVRSDAGKPREQLTLSTSEIKTETACPQRYFFEYEQGRHSAAADGDSAEWGLYVHRSLAQFYRVLKHGWSVDLGLKLALRQIDKRGQDGHGSPYAAPKDAHGRAMLRAVITGYVACWGEADARGFEVLHVEQRYKLPALRSDDKPRRGFHVDGVIDIAWRLR